MPDEKNTDETTDEPRTITDYEEALEVGFMGTEADTTPDEAYTVEGVLSSDEAAKADRRAAGGQGNIAPDLVENPNPQETDPPKKTSAAKKTT